MRPAPRASVSTRSWTWAALMRRVFDFEWKTQPEPDGTSFLDGYINSRYWEYASPFGVLGMAVDSSGNVSGQRIEWVPGGVPGFAHVHFEIGHLPAAPS